MHCRKPNRNVTTGNVSLKIPKGYSEAVKSKDDRQYNGQMNKDKKTNNDLQRCWKKNIEKDNHTTMVKFQNICVVTLFVQTYNMVECRVTKSGHIFEQRDYPDVKQQ